MKNLIRLLAQEGQKMKKLTVGFGMLRDLDPLGRVCMPKEMRKMFHLENEVEVIVTEEGVLVRNPKYVLIEREEYEQGKALQLKKKNEEKR